MIFISIRNQLKYLFTVRAFIGLRIMSPRLTFIKKGLRGRVWVKMVIELPASLAGFEFPRFDSAAGTGMMSRWLLHTNASVSSTHTGSPVSVRWKGSAVSSVIRRRASSPSFGAQKNGLQGMWSDALELVRPHDTAGAGFVQRRHAGLSGIRSSAAAMPLLRPGEAREARFPCRNSVLHEAVCLVCRPALSDEHNSGRRRGAASGLARRQGTGQAVHGGPVGASRCACSQGNWHRRDIYPQGTHLSHRGERSDPAPADLVWRRGSLGGQHGTVLRVAG